MELQTNVKTGDLKITTPEEAVANVEPTITKVPEPDLITRVSKVNIEPAKDNNPAGGISVEEPKFDINDIEKIQDPQAKEQALRAYKSFQRGFNQKFQELAELRKNLETKTKNESNWTPEKIQQLMNDQSFVQAAQQVASVQNPPNSGLTDQEYSALTEKEKAQMSSMQQELSQMRLQNWQMQQKQQDETLKQKYANYAPDIVDTTIHQLVNNEVLATREDIWKVRDYDSAVQRAYQLGKQDRAMENTEKQQSMSVEGFNATPQNAVPKIEQGESTSSYWKRLAIKRLAEFKGQNTR
jgi:hypothetical protein